MLSVRRTVDMVTVADLDREIFPADEPVELSGARWWLASWYGVPVGFAGLRQYADGHFFRRAGVVAEHRGQGIHGRLIAARLRAAGTNSDVYTYAARDNLASANNLVDAGFRLYEPVDRYAGEAIYLVRRGA
jgi:GNAT superfamily N-acetyltransferase